MRKLALFDMVSIDGYFEAPGHNIDWHTVDEEFNDFAIQQLDEAGCLVFGRATYELMASYWPTDAAISDDRQVASRMNAIEKVVASRTLDRAEWEHTKVVHDAALDLAGLKAAPGRDMLVLGSARLSADLIDAGLVDEFRLMVSPILLGAGTPLFRDRPQPLSVDLVEARAFGNGNMLLRYQAKG